MQNIVVYINTLPGILLTSLSRFIKDIFKYYRYTKTENCPKRPGPVLKSKLNIEKYYLPYGRNCSLDDSYYIIIDYII